MTRVAIQGSGRATGARALSESGDASISNKYAFRLILGKY